MTHSVEEQMLDALEYFQYSYRFRNSLFVLAFEPGSDIGEMLTDLKVLQVSHISPVILCCNQPRLADRLEALDRRGLGSRIFHCSTIEQVTRQARSYAAILAEGRMPVIALDCDRGTFDDVLSFTRTALELAQRLSAEKLFFLSSEPGLVVDGKLRSHLSSGDARELLASGAALNVTKDRLQLVLERPTMADFDVVLLQASNGSLFREIFTHFGSGTLFTDEYPNVIRQARLGDVVAIAALHKPYVASGLIRPVSEDEIAADIETYFVFTINQAIVCSAKLSDYGEAAELAKFCTLPRFQGRGRAKRLALHLVDQARERGKKYVFALSIEPKMWIFFESMGFKETPREELPEGWRRSYDFSRPSKALRLDLR